MDPLHKSSWATRIDYHASFLQVRKPCEHGLSTAQRMSRRRTPKQRENQPIVAAQYQKELNDPFPSVRPYNSPPRDCNYTLKRKQSFRGGHPMSSPLVSPSIRRIRTPM